MPVCHEGLRGTPLLCRRDGQQQRRERRGDRSAGVDACGNAGDRRVEPDPVAHLEPGVQQKAGQKRQVGAQRQRAGEGRKGQVGPAEGGPCQAGIVVALGMLGRQRERALEAAQRRLGPVQIEQDAALQMPARRGLRFERQQAFAAGQRGVLVAERALQIDLIVERGNEIRQPCQHLFEPRQRGFGTAQALQAAGAVEKGLNVVRPQGERLIAHVEGCAGPAEVEQPPQRGCSMRRHAPGRAAARGPGWPARRRAGPGRAVRRPDCCAAPLDPRPASARARRGPPPRLPCPCDGTPRPAG